MAAPFAAGPGMGAGRWMVWRISAARSRSEGRGSFCLAWAISATASGGEIRASASRPGWRTARLSRPAREAHRGVEGEQIVAALAE